MPKISSFRRQSRNANKHTERGLKMLNQSIKDNGWIGGISVAADGQCFDGSARLDAIYDQFGEDVEPIIVDADGTRPIIVRRTDIPNADDPKAKLLAVTANRVAQIDLDFDYDILRSLEDEIDLSPYFDEDEIHIDEDEIPQAGEWDNALSDLPSGDKEPFQQMTFTLHDEQVELVKAAMDSAKKMGNYDSLNQNSNGNALARICEIFLTQNG